MQSRLQLCCPHCVLTVSCVGLCSTLTFATRTALAAATAGSRVNTGAPSCCIQMIGPISLSLLHSCSGNDCECHEVDAPIPDLVIQVQPLIEEVSILIA